MKDISIYLYGSFVRGTDTKDSDIDILIILSNFDMHKEIAEKLNRFSHDNKKLEFTIIDIEMFYGNIHYSFSRFFYVSIIPTSYHILGEDIFKDINQLTIEKDKITESLRILESRMIHVSSNYRKKDEINFWIQKYKGWIIMYMRDYIFSTTGQLLYDKDSIKEHFSKISGIGSLLNTSSDILKVIRYISKEFEVGQKKYIVNFKRNVVSYSFDSGIYNVNNLSVELVGKSINKLESNVLNSLHYSEVQKLKTYLNKELG